MLIFVKHEMKGKAMNMLTVKEKEALTRGDIVERAESLLAGITPQFWPILNIHLDTSSPDMTFIAAAPELVRELVDEVKRLQNEIENLEISNEELQRQAENAYEHGYRLGNENYKGPI